MNNMRIVKAIVMTNKFTGENSNVFFSVPVNEFGKVKLVSNGYGRTPESKGVFVYSKFSGWTRRTTLSSFEKRAKDDGWEFTTIIPYLKGIYVEYGLPVEW